MQDLAQTVNSRLVARYSKLAGVVRELAAPLPDTQFWTQPFPFGNSFGHLVLHVTGNLNYYIGAQIAETGYMRDRPREFSESAAPPKQEIVQPQTNIVQPHHESVPPPANIVQVQNKPERPKRRWVVPVAVVGSVLVVGAAVTVGLLLGLQSRDSFPSGPVVDFR